MSKTLARFFAVAILFVAPASWVSADLPAEALAAAKKATRFLTDQVSTQGGYLWNYSADLKLREGEGRVETETIWIQPPGTPSVGEAFVELYEATGDRQFLDAARAAAESLRRGQMRSGGWQASIEFQPERRTKWAYRVDPPNRKEKDQSSLDDDKTQSAIRFLIRLDQATQFSDEAVHEMTLYALDGLITKGQFKNGGFPQVWTDERQDGWETPPAKANYPESWPWEYPGHNEYWYRYTLNDFLANDVMDALFLAEAVYGDKRYREAAIRFADSLLAAQMPDPQPAWAQQYNAAMQPIWARKFEPAAITSSESFGVIDTLMNVYVHTGDRRYLEPIPRALDYLERCELPDGQLARFYELKTNRPLYFTKDYRLTYDDSDVPTHYGFKVSSKVDRIRKRYEKLSEVSQSELASWGNDSRTPGDKAINWIIKAMDDRGAWVSDKPLRYHNVQGDTIPMSLTVKNLNVLAEYLASKKR